MLPEAFDAWFRRATDLDPARRFTTATESVNELGRALGVATPPESRTVGSVRLASVTEPRVAPDAQTIAAKTAPGTELDRQGTLAGATTRSRSLRPLGLVVAGVAVAALAGGFVLRSHPVPSSGADAVRASSAPAAADPEPAPRAHDPAPAATAPEPSTSGVSLPTTPSTASASASAPVAPASPPAKRPTVTSKAVHAKSPAGGATARPSKYTRD